MNLITLIEWWIVIVFFIDKIQNHVKKEHNHYFVKHAICDELVQFTHTRFTKIKNKKNTHPKLEFNHDKAHHLW